MNDFAHSQEKREKNGPHVDKFVYPHIFLSAQRDSSSCRSFRKCPPPIWKVKLEVAGIFVVSAFDTLGLR